MPCLPPISKLHPQKGFTLIEVLVVSPIILLTIATFIGVIIFTTGEVLTARAQNALAYDTQAALNTLEQDISRSGAFLATNALPVVAPQGSNNLATPFSNAASGASTALILRVPATADTPVTTDRNLIYLSTTPYPCSDPKVSQNAVMTVEIVYFVADNTLWRRTIAPANHSSIGCGGSTLAELPSCATTGAAPCQVRDTKILSGISQAQFTVTYYASAASSTALSGALTGSALDRQAVLTDASSVRIRLTPGKTVAGRDITYEGVLRVSRLNNL